MHTSIRAGCRFACLILACLFFLASIRLAQAEEKPVGIWDGFNVGGYASAGILIPRHAQTELAINELSMIVTWEGDSRLKFFSEIELERPLVWREGDDFSKQESYLDIERLYLDYNLNEKLNARVGRYLTPAGRWNLIHASPLVWTSTRPLATSRLFPIALNGVMLYGALPYREEAFEYMLFAEVLKDQDIEHDEVEFRDTFGGRFTLSGKVDWGLSLLEFAENIPGRPRFRMLGLDFHTRHHGWEFSGEAFQRFHTNGNDGGKGAYLQAVAPLGNQWYAIARLENFQRPTESAVDRWLIGTAWRPASNRILKMEYVGGDEQREDAPKGFLASFAILF
ncbi:hypothetical protein MTYP_01698 [Methylophilaceae bacterium]|nr:hypothetical protein MTYP_01698 [Methylophilaceae bacterium]